MTTQEPEASRDQLWHRLTLITLGLTAVVAFLYLLAFLAPPLFGGLLKTEKPEPTPAATMVLPSATASPVASDTPIASWTPEPSRTPRPTSTQRSTATPSVTPGPSPTFPPTWTPAPTEGPPLPTRSNYPFALKDNEIVYTEYFFGSGCDWLGIAGLVQDKEGNPITGLPVVLNGGGLQNQVTYSGNAPAYGESGWEHFLDNKVKEGIFTVQLYSNQGEPISDPVEVHTREDCRANLVMITFVKNWDEYTP
jgi:hypothetical protein